LALVFKAYSVGLRLAELCRTPFYPGAFMKVRAITFLCLLSVPAFGETLASAIPAKLIRGGYTAQVRLANTPVALDASGKGRAIWEVSIPAEISFTNSCLGNAILFQETTTSLLNIFPGMGIPTSVPQTLSVQGYQVKGASMQSTASCRALPASMRRQVLLSMMFSKEDQQIRMPTSPVPMPLSSLVQYAEIAGQLFQVTLSIANIGTYAQVQLRPLGPIPAP
jgi:hypothetical protein